jgi:50S ribosomal protein L16 3-hydroxylase
MSRPRTDANRLWLGGQSVSGFVRNFWERKAAVLKAKSDAIRPFADEALIFPAVVAAGRSRSTVARFYIDDDRVRGDLSQYFPINEDRDFDGYSSRMTEALSGRPFALVVHSLQSHAYDLWNRLGDFLIPLYERVGLPPARADADIFLGTYRRTPFGLHKDTASNFSFVLQGKKRMRVWPFEVFADQAGVPNAHGTEVSLAERVDPAKHHDTSLVLEGSPGDVLYWPSTYWHLGESEGAFHASLNVAYYFPWKPLYSLEGLWLARAEALLGERVWAKAYPFDPRRRQKLAGTTPVPMRSAINALDKAGKDPVFLAAALASWLNRLTGLGFVSVPSLKESGSARKSEVLHIPRARPILHARHGKTLVLSANGHSISLKAEAWIPDLLRRLNQCDSFTLSSCGLRSNRLRDAEKLLTHLKRCRAALPGSRDAPA